LEVEVAVVFAAAAEDEGAAAGVNRRASTVV
jgi:hypothetical protein